jgi:hypothetical protein
MDSGPFLAAAFKGLLGRLIVRALKKIGNADP